MRFSESFEAGATNLHAPLGTSICMPVHVSQVLQPQPEWYCSTRWPPKKSRGQFSTRFEAGARAPKSTVTPPTWGSFKGSRFLLLSHCDACTSVPSGLPP